ncbi:MAG: glucose 1-dehydrogenase [Caldilineaceae bacterium]|nr:glucose 1-dehydrogenase [Caldilineaceae bacterium]
MSNSFLERLFSLQGKTALITGASSGIGRAVAVAFAQAGAVIGVHGRDEARMAETCATIRDAGGQAVALPADLRNAADARTLADQAHVQLGRIDILVNNAGMNRRKPIVEVSDDDYATIMDVNLRSAFMLSKAVHPYMKEQGGGKIINVASMTSTWGLGQVSVYGMSKSALAQVTKVMAVEWAPDNIQVNNLVPGFIRTPLTEAGLWQDEQRSAWLMQRIPADRPGEVDDLIGAALLMASPASAYMTGASIAVDGGFLAGGNW